MNKILKTLAEHEKLLQESVLITKAIGASIEACELPNKEPNQWGVIGRDVDEKMKDKTHLWHAFRETMDDGYSPQLLSEEEISIYLEEEGCQHCIETWRLIGVRKELRKRLGIAKRNIRMFGKQAIKQLESAE